MTLYTILSSKRYGRCNKMSLITDTSTGKSLMINEQDAREREKTRRRLIDSDDLTEDEKRRLAASYRPKQRERIAVKIPDTEVEYLRKLYSTVVVHDFGDIYHMTNEERKDANQLHDLFKEVQQVKSKYKKLDEYVMAYRKVLHVVTEIAKTNFVMSPDKFIEKVMKGKITLYGIQFPKYAVPKKKRRAVNWKVVSEYITNPHLDVSDLVQDEHQKQDWDEVIENPQQTMKDLFGMSYEEYIKTVKYKEGIVDFSDSDDVDRKHVVEPVSRLEFLKFIKDDKEFAEKIQAGLMKLRKFSQMEKKLYGEESDQLVSSVVFDDISKIRAMDADRELLRKRKSDVPEFKGSILNNDDVNRFLYHADEYIKNHTRVSTPNGKMTLTEYRQEELRELLEECGWNIRKFYEIGKEEKRIRKDVKRENDRIKRLKKSLTESEERRSKRSKLVGFSVKKKAYQGVNSDKKKKGKKSKKKKKKFEKQMNQMVMYQTAKDNYDDYESAMLNFDD